MWLKTLHVACAILSVSGYFLRGLLMLRGSALLNNRWVKMTPHVIDTLLLASAIVLAVRLQQYPFVHGWLTAKVLALVAYIVLGAIGLRYGRTRRIRVVAWLAALLTFGYIVAVALTRQALPLPAFN
ncbi:MAG: regulator SirB [Gammaproteobacteria bacterium]|nr:MAG: regulator SirB [Gammaproteobacteria bacterium]